MRLGDTLPSLHQLSKHVILQETYQDVCSQGLNLATSTPSGVVLSSLLFSLSSIRLVPPLFQVGGYTGDQTEEGGCCVVQDILVVFSRY